MGIKRLWTNEQIEEIKKLYIEEGLSCKSIGTKFSTKGETISKILKENNVEINYSPSMRKMNHSYFSTIDTEEKAYFLGLIMTDGSIQLRDRNGLSSGILRIELKSSDFDILQKLKDELNSDAKISFSKRKNSETVRISISSQILIDDLAKYGIIPNKTYLEKSIISDKIPSNLLKHYLRGLIDGDGSIWKDNKGYFRLSFTSFFEEDSFILKEAINSLCEVNGGSVSKGTAWRVTWSGGKQVKKILKELYGESSIHLTRKYNLASECIKEYK